MANLNKPGPTSILHSITLPRVSAPIFALVDTGSSHSHINPSLAKRFPRNQLPEPVQLFLFDGRRAADITHYVRIPIQSSASGPSIELPLLITILPRNVPVVLGMDFLRATRPDFNWDDGRLSFDPSIGLSPLPANSSAAPVNVSLAHSSASSAHSRAFTGQDVAINALVTATPAQSISCISHAGAISEDLSHFFDPDEDPDDIADTLRIVPPAYHSYMDVFSKARADTLPPHRSYDHGIDLLDDKDLPPVGPIYSTSSVESLALKSEIDSLLAKGFIRPSSAPIGAPVLFVKKKDASLRMCIDYRQLNLRTNKNKYPLPPINFLLEQLAGAKVFSKIDLRGAYHLLRIKSGHEWKTTFRCRYGSFEFLVMPFGLTNAPAAFQHLINDVLRAHLDHFVIAYLDDILVYSSDVNAHSAHVTSVLALLRDAGLYAKATKCDFHKDSVEFLGYVVGKNGLGMDSSKVQTILDWPIPRNIKAAQSFLGFANFYRRFIRNYSKIVSPLTALTKKDNAYVWDNTCDSAFNALKAHFTSAPILAHFNPSLSTFLETDASDYAIGTVLSQMGEDNLLHPIAFDSRKMLPAELNYEIHDKELLAIVWAFQRWRSLLLSTSSQIQVLTDHNALEYFMSSKVLTRRQARWAELLAEYDFNIKYRPGKQALKPDALSRRDDVYPTGGDGAYAKNNPHNVRPLLRQSHLAAHLCASVALDAQPSDRPQLQDKFIDALRAAQAEDPTLVNAREQLEQGAHDSATLRDDGILLINGLIAVPDNAQVKLEILRMKHDHPTAGHPGREKTIQLVKRDFHWPKLKDFVQDYVSSCMRCARNKPRRHKPHGLLQPLPVPDRPWSSLSMDHIEQLPKSSGYDAILVIVCRFSKMALFYLHIRLPRRAT